MGELQQLRAALFDLTEQVRQLREALDRPSTQLARQTERLADLLHIMEEVPETITIVMEKATMDVIEEHTSAVNTYMLDR